MAADRFPKIPHFKDPTEPQINVCDHLTAVKRRKLGLGNEKTTEVQTEACGVVFDSTTNKIFLLESGLKSFISIFSQSGELLYTLTTVHMKNPCAIAVDEDNIYVTDKQLHCIFHFKMVPYFHLVGAVGQKGTGEEEFNRPYQLAVSRHGDVFVADFMNDRIKIINRPTLLSSLKYKKHISHHSMTKPCDVKLTPVYVYVLSPRDFTCVHVFSYTGEKIRSLIPGIGLQVVSPQCFCLDADEKLIISNRSCADQIKIFSKEGTLLHTMGKKGDGVGELELTQGITLINNHRIAVASQNKNYRLQIFSYF